jgi:anaerobic magnesium-protoporphyrin IX monomethyl ester cyclase
VRPSKGTLLTSSVAEIGVASRATGKDAGKLHVTFVRGPIVSTAKAFNNEATPCIALAYLSACIAHHGYRFTIVDAIADGLGQTWPLPNRPGFHCQGLTYAEIIERIPADTDVIAVSAMFSGEWPVIRDLTRLIRERHRDALIVAGGEHITALTEFSLRDCRAIDVAVRGEGEQTLYEVLESYRTGGDVSQVSGVAFLDADDCFVQVGGLPRTRDLDTLPWPNWPDGYLERFWRAGKSYGVQTARDMPIMASRGCPYQCTFCSSPSMWTTRYVLREVEDLVAEIKTYIKRYDITALQFYDLTAITKKRWTIEFCNRLIAEGIDIKWSLPSGTRSEALDGETLALLKKTNCNYLVYAPESGSPDTLKIIKKRVDLGRLTESVIEAKRQGIVVRTNLIIGFPHETRRHVAETIRYGLYLAWQGADEVSINIFSPYPGTEIFRALLAQGTITLGDDYFFSLTSLNSDYTSLNPNTCNPIMGARELAIYRIGFMLANYLVGYLRYPSRIFRTIANVFFKERGTATVFEHRLKDVFRRHAA